MKLNHKFALLLAGAVLAGALTGCGASGTPASSAASSEAAASSAVSEAASEPAAEAALPDGVYTADFDTDSSMFHANEANDGKGTLTVKDGQMTFHVSLASKKIVNLYVGMAADAEAHEGDWLQPTTDTVTYSDGLSDEVYGFGIPVEARVMSAHRTPEAAAEFSKNAEKDGFGVIIAAAGKAAHLAGVLAAHTTLPVIGIPVKSSTLDGLDALLATVQMPSGIPVATVAIDGADNAAILAAQMLALSDESIAKQLHQMKVDMEQGVAKKNEALQQKVAEL